MPRKMLAGCLVVGTLLVLARTDGMTAGNRSPYLRLRAASFDPMLEATSSVLDRLPGSLRSLPRLDRLAIIQFNGAPRPEWLDAVRDKGGVIFDYVPHHAYLARIRSEDAVRIHALPFVRTLVPYMPAFRVDPSLLEPGDEAMQESIDLLVQAAPDSDPAALSRALSVAAPQAILVDAGRHRRAILAQITIRRESLTSIIPRLVSISDVFWVEERIPIVPSNNEMKGILQTGQSANTRLFTKGLTGSGQIIGESDSGVDVAHCFFDDPNEAVSFELIDPDNPPLVPATNPFHRKVLAYQFHSASDDQDSDGHGTHVAGTALGDDLAHPSSASDPGLDPFDGMAPGARLVFQDVDRTGGFLEVPANLYGYLQAAYLAGARIHTNSWSASTSSYTSDSSQVDQHTWDHPDMLLFFSAGNSGPDAGTIGSPATAKNVLAVGMVQTPASGSPDNLDAGSSNGPTSDGRLKPEVVNVGGFPIRSAQAGTLCGIADLGGTSMSTPGVAGGAALLRQYLEEGFYPHGYSGSGPPYIPSAALMKALIINSAVGIGGANVDGPIPDNSQGWGRVLLDDVLFFTGDSRRLQILNDDSLTSSTDGFQVGATTEDSFSIFNCRQDVPLKVTLTWTDPPVAPTSGQAWVNDLDLEVESPTGIIYLGNVFANGSSVVGGTPDDRNNVEQVLVPASAVETGSYTVRVIPADVAVGPQPYALAATGDVTLAPAPNLVVTGTILSGSCDNDDFLDDNETIDITFTVQNDGCGDTAPLEARLVEDTTFPVSIVPNIFDITPLTPGASTNVIFQMSLDDTGGGCGGDIPLILRMEEQVGARWEIPFVQNLRLDPAMGSRSEIDDVESGDQSFSADGAWQINSCAVSSGASSWHMGATDCTGIPRDGGAHSIVFALSLQTGENLSMASFSHAFDGYSNASFADSIHFEIDHDLDGTFNTIASWIEGEAASSMSPAGPFDLVPFNTGRASTVHFRFRFQGAANWVGPNNAAGWSVDDFQVDMETFAGCHTPAGPPPGDVGDTLIVGTTGTDLMLSWNPVPDALSYRLLTSELPDFVTADTFTTNDPSFVEAGGLLDTRNLFYEILAVGGCGTVSAD